MADKPIAAPLPADLPENWQAGQIVAPTGEEVNLSHQHGYNYLMEMVNKAQRGVNAVNDAFESVSGKRTCRFVVGTSTAGWTQADCDFLCDGTNDDVELGTAGAGAGELQVGLLELGCPARRRRRNRHPGRDLQIVCIHLHQRPARGSGPRRGAGKHRLRGREDFREWR